MRPRAQTLLLKAVPFALGRRFNAAAADGLDALFELRIRDGRGSQATCFTVRIADGRCEVSPGRAADAGARATLAATDFMRLARGGVAWPELLSSRRLEFSGDPFLALRFPALFKLPAQAR